MSFKVSCHGYGQTRIKTVYMDLDVAIILSNTCSYSFANSFIECWSSVAILDLSGMLSVCS